MARSAEDDAAGFPPPPTGCIGAGGGGAIVRTVEAVGATAADGTSWASSCQTKTGFMVRIFSARIGSLPSAYLICSGCSCALIASIKYAGQLLAIMCGADTVVSKSGP